MPTRSALLRAAAVAAVVFVGLLGWRMWNGVSRSGDSAAGAPMPPPAAFTDVTADAGLAGIQAGAAALVDMDGDGDLDLVTGGPVGAPVRLYANDGAGRFTDRTAAAALTAPVDATSIAAGDYDNDGWIDLFAAGPGRALLLRNVGGRFHDVTATARLAGAAAEAARCAAWLDADLDGDLDLAVCQDTATAAAARPLRLFVNDGGRFTARGGASADVPADSSLAAAGRIPIDYDLDGRIDRLVIGGPADPLQMAWNPGRDDADFPVLPPGGGLSTTTGAVAAGVGDIDGDGDPDVLVLTSNGVRLLRNDLAPARWIRVKLVGTTSNRDALGALVTLTTSGGQRQARVTRGHLSAVQSDAILTFGLAAGETETALTVRWPAGSEQTLSGLATNQTTTLTETESSELTQH